VYAANNLITNTDFNGESALNPNDPEHHPSGIIPTVQDGTLLNVPLHLNPIQSGGSSVSEGGIIPESSRNGPNSYLHPSIAGFVDESYRTLTDIGNAAEAGFHYTMKFIPLITRGPSGYTKSMACQLSGSQTIETAEKVQMTKQILSDPEKFTQAMSLVGQMVLDTPGHIEGASLQDQYMRGALAFQLAAMFIGVGELKALMKGGDLAKDVAQKVAKKVSNEIGETEIISIMSGHKPGTFLLREIDHKPLGNVSTPGKSGSIAQSLDVKSEVLIIFGREEKKVIYYYNRLLAKSCRL